MSDLQPELLHKIDCAKTYETLAHGFAAMTTYAHNDIRETIFHGLPYLPDDPEQLVAFFTIRVQAQVMGNLAAASYLYHSRWSEMWGRQGLSGSWSVPFQYGHFSFMLGDGYLEHALEMKSTDDGQWDFSLYIVEPTPRELEWLEKNGWTITKNVED